MGKQSPPSTGLPEIDQLFQGVRLGDNIVWQVDSIDDYVHFVHPFCLEAKREKRPLIYFRFADHPSVLPKNVQEEVVQLHPEDGFELFIFEIFDVIEKYGKGACYVFDSLSDLTVDWYSDRMLGNFFMLTCPYLYDYETVTYFAILRNHHMDVAIRAIHDTAQIVLDVYNNKDTLYLHPLKVDQRYSPTMYMLHIWDNNRCYPVTSSVPIAEIMTSLPQPQLGFAFQSVDYWTRSFSRAEFLVDQVKQGKKPNKEYDEVFHRILRMVVTRDDRLFKLASQYFDLEDLIRIGKRMVGTGLIGGKSAGMLLARAIIRKSDHHLQTILEEHDSFFMGTDVFYTYLILNRCWWQRRQILSQEQNFQNVEDVHQKLLNGKFPADIVEQFKSLLKYFGQSPIIVRSSSLLEDAYGNSFAGKYESVFCVNQGSPEERLENFIAAVRRVYASTLTPEALAYRAHRGLLDSDEQMAILVQRVSGDKYGDSFFPQVAGVGYSFNPYVWNASIDPKAGVLRIVFGLGTRAVNRYDDDYTRVVALNAPEKRPEANIDEARRYAQQKVEILNLKLNRMITCGFEDIIQSLPHSQIGLLTSSEERMKSRMDMKNNGERLPHFLSFQPLLSQTRFLNDMGRIFKILEEAYQYPVDIEFTLNIMDDDGTQYRINLVQCRPFQVKRDIGMIVSLDHLNQENMIFQTGGPIIGNSRITSIDRLIFVVPSAYSQLNPGDRYSIARLIGRLTHIQTHGEGKILLLGPGRWGTEMPSLGVPVAFSDINTVSILCEIAVMHEGLVPDVSLGTHFFNDLVEMDIQYCAVYPGQKGHDMNLRLLMQLPNSLLDLLPDAIPWKETVKVVEPDGNDDMIYIHIDSMSQQAICYLKKVG
ncbi:PEP/pyruvate-binding domain-containing protein [bacterium]|nr:PEP/pyruvate-binding domain-containing protein [bacterium]RQV96898.1 MAG: pyruvate, phosphate dikinase [bacterium]